MNIKKYLQELNKKTNDYNKSAKNPFLEYNYAYNPFKSAISQTYVWVERINKPDILNTTDNPNPSAPDGPDSSTLKTPE